MNLKPKTILIFFSKIACGANAQVVKSPLSGNRCAPSCDQRKAQQNNGDLRPLACTMMRPSPGCDPLPGFAFKKGQSGDAVRIEDC